jgi:hypothetical protein
MNEAIRMNGTFGWTLEVNWDEQASGLNHKKAAKMDAAAEAANREKKSGKKSKSKWGVKVQPLKPLIGLGSRSLHHYFTHSPSVKLSKYRVDDPIERKKRLDRQRKKPRQRVDDESRASGSHNKYHRKRLTRINQPEGQVSINFLHIDRDDSEFLNQASKLGYICVSPKFNLMTVLNGPLNHLSDMLSLLQKELLPLQRSRRIVSDDFEILSRHFPNPVQVLNTRIITPLFTRKSHCDAFTSALLVKSTQVDKSHGKTDMIMYPDENKDGIVAKNTVVIRTTKKIAKKSTLLKKINQVPAMKTELELKWETPTKKKLKYGRGACTNPIIAHRKHPSQTSTRATRCTYSSSGEPVKHDYIWNFQGSKSQMISP